MSTTPGRTGRRQAGGTATHLLLEADRAEEALLVGRTAGGLLHVAHLLPGALVLLAVAAGARPVFAPLPARSPTRRSAGGRVLQSRGYAPGSCRSPPRGPAAKTPWTVLAEPILRRRQ